MIEGSGSKPLAYGSGSRRPKTMWIRTRIRIRIRNTAERYTYMYCRVYLCHCSCSSTCTPGWCLATTATTTSPANHTTERSTVPVPLFLLLHLYPGMVPGHHSHHHLTCQPHNRESNQLRKREIKTKTKTLIQTNQAPFEGRRFIPLNNNKNGAILLFLSALHKRLLFSHKI